VKTEEDTTPEVDSNIETKQDDSQTGATKRKVDDLTEGADGTETDDAEAKKVKLGGET